MRVFFDSSAFVKRYVSEPGTSTVFDWSDRASEITLSAIALPEMISAFCRLQRENKITAIQYRQLKSALLADIVDIALCDVTPVVLAQSIASLENHALRGMDAIHIASAVAMKVDVFVSADQAQCVAAAGAGLRVEMV